MAVNATYGNFWLRQLFDISGTLAFFNFQIHFPFLLCIRCGFQANFKILIVTIVCPMRVKIQKKLIISDNLQFHLILEFEDQLF